MSVRWIKTDKHVYGAIYREHHENMSVFGTCTAPDGNPTLGIMNPYILTEWGFKDSDEPIIKSVATKLDRHQEIYDYEYFIAVFVNDDDD